MKLKWIPIVAVLVIGLTLAGCGAGVEASTSAGGIASKQLSDAESLALGTLKLEDTAQAVDAEQAAELLPLWKAANTLRTSQTISTVEMDALYAQIREAMTPEQIKAIDAMDFTEAEITEMKSSLGVGLEVASVDTAGISALAGRTGWCSSGWHGCSAGCSRDAGGDGCKRVFTPGEWYQQRCDDRQFFRCVADPRQCISRTIDFDAEGKSRHYPGLILNLAQT